MERMLVGVKIEAKHTGLVDSLVTQFPIKKETDKMIYPDTEGIKDTSAIRYLSQIRKAELGHVDKVEYSTSFRITAFDIVNTSEQLNTLIRRVQDEARMEVDKRRQLSEEWLFSYRQLEGGQ